MGIEELLKRGHARVAVGNRWLIWDDAWVVLEREYRARENTCHYRGRDLTEAIRVLDA